MSVSGNASQLVYVPANTFYGLTMGELRLLAMARYTHAQVKDLNTTQLIYLARMGFQHYQIS
jgi:hypothetical protein